VWPFLLCSPAAVFWVGFLGLLTLRFLPNEVRLWAGARPAFAFGRPILALSFVAALVTSLISLYAYTRGSYKTTPRRWNLAINMSFLLLVFAFFALVVVMAAKGQGH
jgi:hypothetical protein